MSEFRPQWATDYTERQPEGLDPDRPSWSIEIPTSRSTEGRVLKTLGWRLVGATSRRRRRRWWWPFGDPGWITTFYFQRPDNDE
jgi:hypothetical protein